MAKGKLLIICGHTFLCCFYFLLQFHKMNVVGQVSNMIVHFVRKAPNLAH